MFNEMFQISVVVLLLCCCLYLYRKLKAVDREYYEAKLRLNRLRTLESVNKLMRDQLEND